MKYSVWKGLWKSFLPVLIVGLPLVVNALPEVWQNLTLSGAVLLVVNWMKVKHGLKLS
jgi:hypothetical protein